jgi:hypothetical protein
MYYQITFYDLNVLNIWNLTANRKCGFNFEGVRLSE